MTGELTSAGKNLEMSSWDPSRYLKFGDERTQPAVDLVARIRLNQPRLIADLGCGPGNSTQILRTRWPQATVIGIDNSREMIRAARDRYPQQDWLQADVAEWDPEHSFDLVFSNAALQWMPRHEDLIPRLFQMVSPGGAFAFQIPSSTFATVRTLIHEISDDSVWSDRMVAARNSLTMERPAFYYDQLVKLASAMDIWETEYFHVMDSANSIVDWMAGTGLRPFLAALDSESERNGFVDELLQRVTQAYEVRVDGRVLFPFRRMFVIAYR